MKNNFFVSTTNNIENGTIEKYLDVVSTSIVLGVNIFSDWGAELTDVFGGRSGTYQYKLQLVFDDAIKEITKKAREIGANGIVGLKMDFGELSGKGKAMLTVSAIGTAIVFSFNQKDKYDNEKTADFIRIEEVETEIKRREIIKKASQVQFQLDKSDWEYLMQYNISEIAEKLLINFCTTKLLIYNDEQFIQYLRVTDGEVLDRILYNNITTYTESIIALIRKLNRFSTGEILKLIDSGEIDIVVSLLNANQSVYNKSDIKEYKQISEKLNNLPDKGSITKKKGILSKEKDVYCCVNKHTNHIEMVYCERCGQNIKGLNKRQVDAIKQFEEKVAALSELFK